MVTIIIIINSLVELLLYTKKAFFLKNFTHIKISF